MEAERSKRIWERPVEPVGFKVHSHIVCFCQRDIAKEDAPGKNREHIMLPKDRNETGAHFPKID